MEQLFRALYEVKDLTVWQTISFWITRFLTISFEMFVEDGLISFYVLCPKGLQSIVEKQITSFYPNAEVTPKATPEIWPKGYKLVGYNMLCRKTYEFPLRFYDHMQDDPLNDLVNVLSKLHPDETATIQVIISPTFTEHWSKHIKSIANEGFKGKKKSFIEKIPGLGFLGVFINMLTSADAAKNFAPGSKGGDSFVRMIQPEEELYKRMGEKAGMSGYHTTVRVLAGAKTWERALDITNNLQVAFNVFKDMYGNYFRNKRMMTDFMPLEFNQKMIYPLWKRRINGYAHKRNMLVEKELASIYHFPDSRYNTVPNIDWVKYKILPPPPNAPTTGILLGINRFRGLETKVRFMDKDRTRHQYIIGKSLDSRKTEEITEFLLEDPCIEHILEFKSVAVDINKYRIFATVEWNGSPLYEEIYEAGDLKEEFENIKDDFKEFTKLIFKTTDRIPRLIGNHIDGIEKRIVEKFPEVTYVDIEIN
jgi:hypothetical protein